MAQPIRMQPDLLPRDEALAPGCVPVTPPGSPKKSPLPSSPFGLRSALLASPKACTSPSRKGRRMAMDLERAGPEKRSWTSVMGFEDTGHAGAGRTGLKSFDAAADNRVYSAVGDANAPRARGNGIVVGRTVTLLPGRRFVDTTVENWVVPPAVAPGGRDRNGPPLVGSKVWSTTGTYRVLNDLPQVPGEGGFTAALELRPAEQRLTHTILTERVMTMPGGAPYAAELTGDEVSASLRIDADQAAPGPIHLEQEPAEPPAPSRTGAAEGLLMLEAKMMKIKAEEDIEIPRLVY